jgi:Tol biopolymer transport system component
VPPAHGAVGDYTLLSTTALGANTTGLAGGLPVMSANGDRVAFQATSELVAGVDTSNTQVFVRDVSDGQVWVASSTASGDGANGGDAASQGPSITSDGNLVAFVSSATDLGGPAGVSAVYVKNLSTAALTVVSPPTGACSPIQNASIAGNGSVVAFDVGVLIGADCTVEVYAHNLATSVLTAASTDAGGVLGEGRNPAVNGDGTKVAFDSASAFDVDDDNARRDVYLKNLGAGGAPTWVSVEAGTIDNPFDSTSPAIAASGTRVAFHSSTEFTSTQAVFGTDDVFVKDTVSGTMYDASHMPDSTQAGGVHGGNNRTRISADGNRVSFVSTRNGIAGTGTAAGAGYVADIASGLVEAADGLGGGIPALSGNGRFAAFQTIASRASADTDSDSDLYLFELTAPSGPNDQDFDGVADDDDLCPAVAEDDDDVQDADGCPEDPSHDIAVTSLSAPSKARSGATKVVSFKIRNLGTHVETAVPYFFAADNGATYAGCSGDAASLSRDGDLDVGETVTVRCSVTFAGPGTVTHTARADHGSAVVDVRADNNLSNNERTALTTAT